MGFKGCRMIEGKGESAHDRIRILDDKIASIRPSRAIFPSLTLPAKKRMKRRLSSINRVGILGGIQPWRFVEAESSPSIPFFLLENIIHQFIKVASEVNRR